MSRKRPPAAPSAARQGREARVPPAASDWPLWPLAVLAIVVLIYLRLFYADVPDQHFKQRTASLNFLVAPDELFSMWCGGRVANFSLLDRWPIVLLTLLVLGTAFGAGRLALLALRLDEHLDRLERIVFSLGVGLNLVSLFALLVGLAGGLRQSWLFWMPTVLLLVGNVALFAWRRRIAGPREQVWSRPGNDLLDDRRWLWWLLAALPFAGVILLGAMLPPWDYDVREYHLQTPKEWFLNGRIEFLPHNIYANMPLGSEMTALYAMALAGGDDGWWWGAMAGKTTMACYALIAAMALVAFGRRIHSLAVGVLAAVVFLSSPWIVWLATAGYNEGPVALFGLLAIYAAWLAHQSSEKRVALRFVALCGFAAGAAVACKYPPLLFVVVPLFLGISLGYWLPINVRLQAATVFTLGCIVACGPWFMKNWALTNNPTYPLLYSALDGRTRTPEKHAQWQRVHSPQPDSEGRRFTARSFLQEIAWNGWRTLWASITLPPLVLVAWLSRRYWRLLGAFVLWMAFVFVAWWLFTHRLDRFLVLLLPIAALMAAIGVFAVPHPVWRAATLGFVVVGLTLQFPFVSLHPDNRYFAPLDRLRRDDRDLGEVGVRIEAAHRWLNANARPGERVLLVGDAEPFDLECRAVYNTCFDDCQFTRLFKGRSREERMAALTAVNIKYVFFSWAHLARYRSPGNYGYTSDYPTPELVHGELVTDQELLIPIPLEASASAGELFRVAAR